MLDREKRCNGNLNHSLESQLKTISHFIENNSRGSSCFIETS